MFGLTVPFAIEAVRRSPVRHVVRNLAFSQGDDINLAIQVYAEDGSPVDLTFGVVTVTVQRESWGAPGCSDYDYGFGYCTLAEPVTWVSQGAVTDGTTGQTSVAIPRSVTGQWWGRFRLYIAIDGIAAGFISSHGVLDVRKCPLRLLPVFGPLVPSGDFASSDFASSDFLTGAAPGPPAIQKGDFSSSDFDETNFLSSGELNSSPARFHTMSIADDFSMVLTDDYGKELFAS